LRSENAPTVKKHFLQYHTEFGQSGILLKNHEKTLKYAQNVRMLIEIHLRWQVAFFGMLKHLFENLWNDQTVQCIVHLGYDKIRAYML